MAPLAVCTFNVWHPRPLDNSFYNTGGLGETRQPLRVRRRALEDFFRLYHKEVDLFLLQECSSVMCKLVMNQLSSFGFQMLDVADANQERVFYRTSRLRVVESSDRPLVDSTVYHVTQATMLLDGEFQFAVANIHLSWQAFNWDDEKGPENRKFAEMVDICSKLPKGGPLVVAGDMNDTYVPLRVARERLQLMPCFAMLHAVSPPTIPTPGSTPPEWECDGMGEKAYDWILQRDMHVVSAQRLDFSLEGIYPSDHYPVLATYELNSGLIRASNL